MIDSLHPLDDALALTEAGPGSYTARTSPAYWNMVGPFGGITAAVLLQAVMRHPERLGDPLSLTVNYAGAIAEGEFTVQAVPVRTNRSTQHWTLSVLQPGADGEPVVTTTATAVTAVRRETWSLPDTPMPEVAGPEGLERVLRGMPVKWLDRYPSDRFFRVSLQAIGVMLAALDAPARASLRRKVLNDCTRVAAASRGPFDWSHTISTEEQHLINRIAAALS